MSKQLALHRLPSFRNTSQVQKLNDVFAIQNTLMPHQVAVATGCSLDDALTILLLLYDRYLAESFLLVYHVSHPEQPILTRKLSEGPPSVPVQCDLCERVIENDDELAYDYLFKTRDQINLSLLEE